MHFFYNYDVPFNNFKNILKSEGKVLITDIWTNESLFMFLTKCKQHEMKVLSIEDLTNQTIQAMEDVQSERLTFFKQNINRQYKFIIKKEK